LLETDTQIVVPVDKVVKLQLTSADVLHAWTIPAFGVKMDAVPGRLNETWFKANKEGIYYGQCSELCGPKHAFMPINVKVVSNKEFEEWIEFAKSEYASQVINYSDDTFEMAKK
jgi:cytochrome c oxidase subunit 2